MYLDYKITKKLIFECGGNVSRISQRLSLKLKKGKGGIAVRIFRRLKHDPHFRQLMNEARQNSVFSGKMTRESFGMLIFECDGSIKAITEALEARGIKRATASISNLLGSDSMFRTLVEQARFSKKSRRTKELAEQRLAAVIQKKVAKKSAQNALMRTHICLGGISVIKEEIHEPIKVYYGNIAKIVDFLIANRSPKGSRHYLASLLLRQVRSDKTLESLIKEARLAKRRKKTEQHNSKRAAERSLKKTDRELFLRDHIKLGGIYVKKQEISEALKECGGRLLTMTKVLNARGIKITYQALVRRFSRDKTFRGLVEQFRSARLLICDRYILKDDIGRLLREHNGNFTAIARALISQGIKSPAESIANSLSSKIRSDKDLDLLVKHLRQQAKTAQAAPTVLTKAALRRKDVHLKHKYYIDRDSLKNLIEYHHGDIPGIVKALEKSGVKTGPKVLYKRIKCDQELFRTLSNQIGLLVKEEKPVVVAQKTQLPAPKKEPIKFQPVVWREEKEDFTQREHVFVQGLPLSEEEQKLLKVYEKGDTPEKLAGKLNIGARVNGLIRSIILKSNSISLEQAKEKLSKKQETTISA